MTALEGQPTLYTRNNKKHETLRKKHALDKGGNKKINRTLLHEDHLQ